MDYGKVDKLFMQFAEDQEKEKKLEEDKKKKEEDEKKERAMNEEEDKKKIDEEEDKKFSERLNRHFSESEKGKDIEARMCKMEESMDKMVTMMEKKGGK